jgi:hypothetical protein
MGTMRGLIEAAEAGLVVIRWDEASDPADPGWVWEYGTGAQHASRAVPGRVGRNPQAKDGELKAAAQGDPFFPKGKRVVVQRD